MSDDIPPAGRCTPPAADDPRDDDEQYLLVLSGRVSSMHVLPAEGEVVVGRSQQAAVRLDDHEVSRQHACLTVRQGEVAVRDLDSQNGTLINGERLRGTRLLLTGDILVIGKATLVFHAGRRAVASVAPLDFPAFRERLAGELLRARKSQRGFACLCVELGKRLDERRVGVALARLLRRIDAATWAGDSQLFVLLPEADAGEALAAAERLRDGLVAVGAEPRVGHALHPGDATSEDGLLAAARAAAMSAPPRGVAAAGGGRRLSVGGAPVVVADPAMLRLYALVEHLAVVDLPVLIGGETGVGKEVCARALHEKSARAAGPFVAINCAALPEHLVESELFGHERGAFSGAVAAKIGLLESAAGGTAFLDEIGDLPAAAQAKLLRVLESGRLTRLGELRERTIDLRVVAASHRDLPAEVRAGRFRQDLYFRLAGAVLHLPPLRERPAEIPLVAQRFLEEACLRASRPPMTLAPDALAHLAGHGWPGNLRELRNLMGYLAASLDGTLVEGWQVAERLAEREPAEPPAGAPPPTRFRPLGDELREIERRRILQALDATGGNQARAAGLLAVPLRTFFDKLRLHGIPPRRGRS